MVVSGFFSMITRVTAFWTAIGLLLISPIPYLPEVRGEWLGGKATSPNGGSFPRVFNFTWFRVISSRFVGAPLAACPEEAMGCMALFSRKFPG